MSNLAELFTEFKDIHQRYNRLAVKDEHGLLEQANEFEGVADGHFQVLMNYRSTRSLSEDNSNISKRLEVMLREERNTWRLLKALVKDQLISDNPTSVSVNGSRVISDYSHDSNRMDDSDDTDLNHSQQNGIEHVMMNDENLRFSEDQIIGNYYVSNAEIRRMQVIVDWLEANEASDLDYHDKEDKVEFYAEGSTCWENTFHAIRARYNTEILDLDITVNSNAGLELCPDMDPDAPLRTKKTLAHQDKEVEIRLFKHLFRFIRAGKLDEGQKLAQRVSYHWLSAFLEGWLPFSDPNLDQENLGTTAIHQLSEVQPVTGNKKRDIWKRTCFMAARTPGLNSFEKAILGVFGGNLKSALPACRSWADQLWARIKCSIDVKIEIELREHRSVSQENRDLIELPPEFYESYKSLEGIFQIMGEQQDPYNEATIHQKIQKYFILNDIDGLMNKLSDWCALLVFNDRDGISPQFLRFFAHVVLFLREVNLIGDEDARGTKIIESYIETLTKVKLTGSVAYYSARLPRENQTLNFSKLLATISDHNERKSCLTTAREYGLDVDEVTQNVVELIRNEIPEVAPSATGSFKINTSMGHSDTPKTTSFDKRKIDALDYLKLLEVKNYIAILHHGNILLRYFSLQRKMAAARETFLKLPSKLNEKVENQWRDHTNRDVTLTLRNNLRELDGFKVLLDAQEELGQWSEWHHKKPEEPRKPANLAKFCDNVNYEQRLKQYQQDLNVWHEVRESKTNALIERISQIFHFDGGWMCDLPTGEVDDDNPMDQTTGTNATATRLEQLGKLRRHFIPYMISICFNIFQLTSKYEDCLKLSHLLANDQLKLYEYFSKAQLRDFLDKISEVTKLIVKQSITEETNH